MFKTMTAALLALLLVACGGGSDPEPEQVSQLRTLQLFGDSTQVQAAPVIEGYLPGRMLMNAKSGATSAWLIAGTDGVNPPWPQSVKGDVIMINFGINDSADLTTGSTKGISIDTYKANLRTFAKVPGAVVVFETPNPTYWPGRHTEDYAQAMREVAAELGVPLIDVHAFVMAMPDWQAQIPDKLHPSPELMRKIVADCVMPELRKLL
jgi:lysophospholipase L1-like esterase